MAKDKYIIRPVVGWTEALSDIGDGQSCLISDLYNEHIHRIGDNVFLPLMNKYWNGFAFVYISSIVNNNFANLGTADTIPKFGAMGLADSLLTETATGINLTLAGTAKAVNDHLVLINPTNAADMDGTGTGILFRQWYYNATTPAIADACRIAYVTNEDWTVSNTRNGFLSFSMSSEGDMTELLRLTSDQNVNTFQLFTTDDIWDDANELASTGMMNKQYAMFGPYSIHTGGFSLIAARDGITSIHFTGRSTIESGTSGIFNLRSEIKDGSGGVKAVGDTSMMLELQNYNHTQNAFYGDGSLTQHYTGIAHGMTDFLPTDAYGKVGRDVNGGLVIIGAADEYPPLSIYAIGNTTQMACRIIAAAPNGTGGVTYIDSAVPALIVYNNTAEIFKIKGSGVLQLSALAGTGTRNVVVDAYGVLSAP